MSEDRLFSEFQGQYFVISGVANRKSVATHVARILEKEGSKLILTVESEEHLSKAQKMFPDAQIFVVNVEDEKQVKDFGKRVEGLEISVNGFVHSLAFANYGHEIRPFHETQWEDFAQASHISCYSLISMTRALRPSLSNAASVVTVSISNTRATTYGYMGPIKAALDSSVAFLAKSLSYDSRARANAVCSGPLKTSASAGIPGYIDNYLYAEKLTLRKEALKTAEVANTILFLLSSQSSGINGTGLVVDAGMSCNYFDEEVVKSVTSDTKNLS